MARVPADSAYPTGATARPQPPVGGGLFAAGPFEARYALVERLARQLTRESFPRFHLLTILLLAGGATFLAAASFLWSAIPMFESMTVRYPAAALCGYLSFIVLIRIWIALHRGAGGSATDVDPAAIVDVMRVASSPTDVETVEGGRTAAGGFRDGVRSQSQESGRNSGADWGIDLDDGVWITIAATCVIGGLVAIAYVIYIAPVLLAEVALDAAIISALYRRLREDEAGHWLVTVVTRTWLPALVVVAFAALAGFALQQFAPEARSIGDVFWS
jgi:hypothetical protein